MAKRQEFLAGFGFIVVVMMIMMMVVIKPGISFIPFFEVILSLALQTRKKLIFHTTCAIVYYEKDINISKQKMWKGCKLK